MEHELLIEEILDGLHFRYQGAFVGKIDEDYKINLYEEEEPIPPVPHFHITKGDIKSPEFHACIKIEEAEYYHHGRKLDVLNEKQKNDLIKFLNSYRKSYERSGWETIVMLWDMNNPDYEISQENLKMPDYSLIGEK